MAPPTLKDVKKAVKGIDLAVKYAPEILSAILKVRASKNITNLTPKALRIKLIQTALSKFTPLPECLCPKVAVLVNHLVTC